MSTYFYIEKNTSKNLIFLFCRIVINSLGIDAFKIHLYFKLIAIYRFGRYRLVRCNFLFGCSI